MHLGILANEPWPHQVVKIAGHGPAEHSEDNGAGKIPQKKKDEQCRSPDNSSAKGRNDGGDRHDTAPEHRSLDPGESKGQTTDRALHDADHNNPLDGCPRHRSNRITSYNVCYTKLLRHLYRHHRGERNQHHELPARQEPDAKGATQTLTKVV